MRAESFTGFGKLASLCLAPEGATSPRNDPEYLRLSGVADPGQIGLKVLPFHGLYLSGLSDYTPEGTETHSQNACIPGLALRNRYCFSLSGFLRRFCLSPSRFLRRLNETFFSRPAVRYRTLPLGLWSSLSPVLAFVHT